VIAIETFAVPVSVASVFWSVAVITKEYDWVVSISRVVATVTIPALLTENPVPVLPTKMEIWSQKIINKSLTIVDESITRTILQNGRNSASKTDTSIKLE
jgi:hypothetical protein